MAIANRELDSSEQKVVIQAPLALVATGKEIPVYTVPRPMTLVSAYAAAIGLSGSPTGVLKVNRNTSGGATLIAGGMTTLTLQAAGTSGPQACVLAASGSSFLSLAKGDVVSWTSGGANTAAYVQVALVVQATQDIKSHF